MSDADDHAFQRLVHDAVQACAPNFTRECIEAEVAARRSRLTASEQAKVDREIERVLSFREPDAPYKIN